MNKKIAFFAAQNGHIKTVFQEINSSINVSTARNDLEAGNV
jgi:hypothetical protein